MKPMIVIGKHTIDRLKEGHTLELESAFLTPDDHLMHEAVEKETGSRKMKKLQAAMKKSVEDGEKPTLLKMDYDVYAWFNSYILASFYRLFSDLPEPPPDGTTIDKWTSPYGTVDIERSSDVPPNVIVVSTKSNREYVANL